MLREAAAAARELAENQPVLRGRIVDSAIDEVRRRWPAAFLVKRNENGLRIGESHPRAKYTDAEVEKVFMLADAGKRVTEIARTMEMPKSTVSLILSGRIRNQVAVRIEADNGKKKRAHS